MTDPGSETSSNGSGPGEGGGGRFKTVKKGVVETDLQYVGSMIKAYTTSHSLAVEIEDEIPLFVAKARTRIMGLIQVIGQLRKDLYDAKMEVVKVNQRLHSVLTMQELQVDFAEYEKELENSIMKAETPAEIDGIIGGQFNAGGTEQGSGGSEGGRD